jgi:hypothetical protein
LCDIWNGIIFFDLKSIKNYILIYYDNIHTYISHFTSPKYNGHETGHKHNTNKQSGKTIQTKQTL